jgi:hypothetical protein
VLRAVRAGRTGTELGTGAGRDGRGVVSRRGATLSAAAGVLGISSGGATGRGALGVMMPSDSATARGAVGSARSGAGATAVASLGETWFCLAAM